MDKTKNCREYCPYSKYCYEPGEAGLDPDDCPRAWRIEDWIIEAKYSREEECHE